MMIFGKITAALAATLAFAGLASAASPTIPAEYRGEWCRDAHPYYSPKALTDRYVPKAEIRDCVKITARRFETQEEYACDLVSVALDSVGNGHIIKFSCHSDEGGHRTVETISQHLWTSTGTKGIGKRLYIDDNGTEKDK